MADIILSQIPTIQKVQYNEYEYQVDFNGYKVLFNDASKDFTHLMAVEKDDTLLRFQVPGVTPKETLITDNTLFYPEVFTNVDASYEILEDRVKETIIIKDASALHKFEYSTIEKNINASFKEDGSIVYLDENENELYTIEAPYAFDANNNEVEVNMSNQISGYTLEVVPDTNTIYPIYLDPTITMKTTSTYAWFEVSSALTPYGSTAVREIDLNTFDITSLKVSYISNTAKYCIYTFKSIDSSNTETVICTINKTTNAVITVPTDAKKLKIEAAWAVDPGTTTTVYDGIHLVNMTTNAKGLIYGANSYSQNFTTLTTYGTIEDSQVTNIYPLNAIGNGGSTLPYYMNSSTGKFVLRYTDDSSVVHNVYMTDYSSGLLSEPIPVSKLSSCNCYVYSNSGGTYSSSTNTVEVIFFNNKAISAATINVNLTFDFKRAISKSNVTTYDSKRSIATTNSITADSKRPVCVAANIHLDTIRTSVQNIVLISDTKKMKISNISSIVDLKRAVGISQSISIDTIRLATISQQFSSDTYRTIQKSTSLTLDVSRRTTSNLSFSLDTVRKSAVSDNIYLDINRKISKTTALTLDSLRKTYVGSMWVERTAQKYQDGTLYTSVKTKNLIPNVIPSSEYALDGYGLFGLDLVIGFRDPATNTFWSPYPSEYNLPVTVVVNGVQKSFTAVYTSKYITVNSYNVNLYTLKITSDVPITSFGYVVPNGSAHLTGDSVIYSSKNANSNTYLKYYYKYGTYINTTLTLDEKKTIVKTNNLNLDTTKNTIVSKSSTLDLKRSVGVQDNILIDSQKSIVKSLELNVDAIKGIVADNNLFLDTQRRLQSNISNVFDSIRNIANQNVFSSDTIRTTLATDYLTLDSQRQTVASESVVFDTKRKIAAQNNVSLDTEKTVRIEINNLILDTKRCLSNDDTSNIFLDTKKIVYSDLQATVDTNRKIRITSTTAYDTDKQIAIEVNLSLDTSKQVIQEHSQNITIDTERQVVTNENISIDTKKVSTVTSNITSDTLRGTSVTDGIQLDTIKVIQSKVGLVTDVTRDVTKFGGILLDTKRSTALLIAQNLDSSRTIAVSDVLRLDTERHITFNQTVNLNLDTKRSIVAEKSVNLDTLRKYDYIISGVNYVMSLTNSSTSYDSEATYSLTKDLLGFKIKTTNFYVTKSGLGTDTVKLNSTSYSVTGTASYSYTNTIDDLVVDLKAPKKSSSAAADNVVNVTFTKMTTTKPASLSYSATTMPTKTMLYNCIINKAVYQYGAAKTSILVNGVSKTLPCSVKKDDVISIAGTPLSTGNYLFLQYDFQNVVTLNLDTNRQIAIKDNIALDSKRVIIVQDNQSLDITRITQQNIASSVDTIRKLACNVSTSLDQMRLIASESNLSLDTFREVVNHYVVHLSADTLRVAHKYVAEKEDLLRNVIITSSTNIDTFRQITLKDNIDLDIARTVERSISLTADTSKKVNKAEIVNYDLKRKVAANVNQTLDTLKVIGINSIYLLDTERIIQVKPVFKIDTNRQVIKDINEYKDMVRKLTVEDLITADILREVQLRPQLILDAERMISNNINTTFDTKRVIFISSSNLYPTLELSFLLKDEELIELLRSYNNSLEFSDSQSPALDVEAVDGSKITIAVSKVEKMLEVTINDN